MNREQGARRLILVVLALAALGMAGCRTTARTAPPVVTPPPGEQPATDARGARDGPSAVGLPAPDFTVTDVDGSPRSLSDYQGKIVAIDFWATYCKPCVKKLREYETLYQAHKNHGVEFLALSSDSDDAVIKGWREENPLSIPLARMDDQTRAAFFGAEQFVTIPQMRLVDRKGVIRYSFGPDSETAELEAALTALVGEKK